LDEFMLMTLCDDFIIPNSTFSWWAAWLSKAENKTVICPSKWLKHIDKQSNVPNDWIKI
jgi:hypothetical protein